MIRQPISRGLYLALGVSSFITLGAIYTGISLYADSKLVPTWEQIYREGIKPAFLPRKEEGLPYFAWVVTIKTTQGESIKGELMEENATGYVLKMQDGEEMTVPRSDVAESKGENVKTSQTRTYPPLIWGDAKATVGRLFIAFAVATLIAVPLGLLMGCYQYVEAFFVPPLSFLAKIPATAMLTVFLVATNSTFQFLIAIVMFGLIPILAQTVFRAAKEDVPEELLFKARTLGAGQINCIFDVIFKYILPNVMEAVRLQIGPAVVYLMAAEWARGNEGFGCQMRLLIKSLDMSIIFTYLIVLGVVGLAVDNGLIWLRRRLFPWYAQ